jgi:hypothetical protein
MFEKELKYQILSKSVQCETSCSMRMDRQTDGHNKANKVLWAAFYVQSKSVFNLMMDYLIRNM